MFAVVFFKNYIPRINLYVHFTGFCIRNMELVFSVTYVVKLSHVEYVLEYIYVELCTWYYPSKDQKDPSLLSPYHDRPKMGVSL
jgi:hypothetical protein